MALDLSEISTFTFKNDCPFCPERMSNFFVFGKHLVAAHKTCLNTKIKGNPDEDWDTNRIYISKASDGNRLILGNKIKALQFALKDNFSVYIDKLKEWMDSKFSRREFDECAKSLFNDNTIELHYEFMICFLSEVRLVYNNAFKMRSTKATKEQTKATTSKTAATNTDDIGAACISTDDVTANYLKEIHTWEIKDSSVDKSIIGVVKQKDIFMQLMRDAISYRRRTIYVRPDGFEYDITKVDSKEVTADDKLKYTGKLDMPEIVDAMKNEEPLKKQLEVYLLSGE